MTTTKYEINVADYFTIEDAIEDAQSIANDTDHEIDIISEDGEWIIDTVKPEVEEEVDDFNGNWYAYYGVSARDFF